MQREMTPETRQKLAGFALFPAGSPALKIPTAPAFKHLGAEAPEFFIKPYSVKGLAKRRDQTKPLNERIAELFTEGEGLVGWDKWFDLEGNPTLFTPENVRAMVGLSGGPPLEALMLYIDRYVIEFAIGPLLEEREGLESSPVSA
jgi:hypothetical protein